MNDIIVNPWKWSGENNLSSYTWNSHMTGYIVLKDLLFNKGFFFCCFNFFKQSKLFEKKWPKPIYLQREHFKSSHKEIMAQFKRTGIIFVACFSDSKSCLWSTVPTEGAEHVFPKPLIPMKWLREAGWWHQHDSASPLDSHCAIPYAEGKDLFAIHEANLQYLIQVEKHNEMFKEFWNLTKMILMIDVSLLQC